VLFAGWSTDWKLFAAIGIGLVLLAVSQLTRSAADRPPMDWRASAWMWPWLLGLMVLSYLASFEGGRDELHFGVDMAVTAAFSLLIYYFALSCRLSPAQAEERVREGGDEQLAV
jgi:quinol-cytochrome oxidoreductase complex cytochrome b subunit